MLRSPARPFVRTSLTLALGAVLTLSSCAKVQEMHDATMGMSKTTNEMNETTCKMYTSLRQGNSKVSRDTDIEAIRKGSNISEKLAIAAKYMQGLEYQVWSRSCNDVAPREIAFSQAVNGILTDVQEFAGDRSKVVATKRSAQYETLYALAATLHRTNDLQAFYLKGTNEKIVRPLDLIMEGLRYNRAKNRGELGQGQIPEWAALVGKYTHDAEYLLRLRANFLMAYGYAVADSDRFGNTPSLMQKVLLIGKTKFLSKAWTPKLENMDPTELRERVVASLVLAQETRKGLESLEIDPMTDETIMGIWKAADFSKFDLKAMSEKGGEDRSRADAIQELMDARSKLIGEKPADHS
jgi:hypothetical protein